MSPTDNVARMIDLPDLSATESFGRKLGQKLIPNSIVALIGPLGAGKTHLSRAICEGLQIRNPQAVTSPTFVLIQEYPGRLPIFHFDVYRLRSDSEFLELGVEEYFVAGGVCLIEWADRVRDLLPFDRIEIELVPTGPDSRQAILHAGGPESRGIIQSL